MPVTCCNGVNYSQNIKKTCLQADLVNARFVVGEVLKDSEGRLDGSVGDQLHLDLVHVALNGVALLSVALVLLVGNLELGVLTGSVTLGSATSLLARAPCSVHVVLTRLDLVRLAALLRPELTAADQTLAAPEAPSCAGESAVAAESAGVAAGEQVLAGHVHVLRALRVDADPVRHGGDGAKGPAGATTALISDLPDCWTLRPLLARVKILRQ